MNQHPLQHLLSQTSLKNLLSDSAYLSQIKNPNTSDQARIEYLYIRGFYDFRFFVETFFAHHCGYPFSSMHEEFFRAEQDPPCRSRREVIVAPRGHAKTTFKVLFKIIHAIVYGYEKFVVIIGHSAPEAEGKVRDILEELTNNTLLQEVYGDIAPIKGQQGWGTKNFVTQNGIRVMAKSRGKQVRGLKHGRHRPTLIILDDIESPDKVLSESQRYKTKQWLEKDILKLGNVDGQINVMVIGTCLHTESLLSELLVSSGWQGIKYQAVLSFAKNQSLWEEWKRLITDLTDLDREKTAQAFYEDNKTAMLEGTQVLWPEAESYLRLMEVMVHEGQASFQSEKQNDPYDPERQIFDMNKAKRFKVEYDSEGEILGLRWIDIPGRFINYHELYIIAFHDPAMAEGKDPDYAAIVVCACDRYGHIYCLDAYIEKVIPSRQIKQAFELHKKWKFQRLYLEDNNFQGILKHHYRDELNKVEGSFMLSGVTQHSNKEKRIASMEPSITHGHLLFNVDLTPRFINQMHQFPTTNDDGPDALHGCFEQLRRRTGLI